MLYKDMVNVLSHNSNCYVAIRPTEAQLNRLRKHFNCDFTVRETVTPDVYGYVIEKEVNK